MNKNALLAEKFKRWPMGLWLMSRVICWRAPYFKSIRPCFTVLEPGRGEAVMKNRRAVRNHLGTVHAIAMANLCEFVGGCTLEVTVPSTHRWIPKSMNIKYLAKANSDLRATTKFTLGALSDAESVNVRVDVSDRANQAVVSADIEMYLTRRK